MCEKKFKIYLSSETANFIIENDCDIGSAENEFDAELMGKVIASLREYNRDSSGKFTLSREELDFVLAALDWYCSAYYNDQGE